MPAPIPVKIYRVIPSRSATLGVSNMPTADDYLLSDWVEATELPDGTVAFTLKAGCPVEADGNTYIMTMGDLP